MTVLSTEHQRDHDFAFRRQQTRLRPINCCKAIAAHKLESSNFCLAELSRDTRNETHAVSVLLQHVEQVHQLPARLVQALCSQSRHLFVLHIIAQLIIILLCREFQVRT